MNEALLAIFHYETFPRVTQERAKIMEINEINN